MGLAVSSAPGLPRRAEPSYASSPGPCRGREPWGHRTPPQGTRQGPGLGPAAFGLPHGITVWTCQQPAAPALFQRRRVSTWARGAVRISTAAATTETSCQTGTAAAGRAAGARRTPPVFYLLCFSCTGLSATWQWRAAPRTALSRRAERQRTAVRCWEPPAVPGAAGCHPWGPSPCHPAFAGAASSSRCCGPAVAVNLFSRRCCPILCRFI